MKIVYLLASLLLSGFPLHASAESTIPQAPAVAQVSPFTEINFVEGQSNLDPFARQSLDQVVRDANARGTIDVVQVISWGDANAGASAEQIELARNRAREVENYLASRGNALTIRTYNMVEKPSALRDLMNSSDARMQYSLTAAGLVPGSRRSAKATVLVIMRPN